MTAVAGMVLLSVSGHGAGDASGPQVTLEVARHMPEFYPGGRSVFFQYNLFAYFLGRGGSILVTLLFVFYFFFYNFSGGVPRSFGFPLLLGCTYVLVSGRWWCLSALLLLQSLFYPPILLNSAALAALTWWRSWRHLDAKQAWTRLVALGVGVGLAAGALCSVYTFFPNASFGRLITRQEAKHMPEFSVRGRTPFFGDTFWQTAVNNRAGIRANRLVWLGALILAMAVLCRPSRLVIPRAATDLLVTSLALFGLAHLVLFKLHLPARYVMFTLPLAAWLILAANVESTRAAIQQRWPRQRLQQWLGRAGRRWAILGCMGLCLLYTSSQYFVISAIQIDPPTLQLYRYLRTLPKGSLIAGHPLALDHVPLFARRKVLANKALSLPYYTAYYAKVRQRLFAMLTAYYTDDEHQLWRFVQRYGVDYMLVDTRHFAASFLRGPIYYEPFGSFIHQQLLTQRRFALLEVPPAQRVYADGPYIVVSFAAPPPGYDSRATPENGL
jgi:hypothetical protein